MIYQARYLRPIVKGQPYKFRYDTRVRIVKYLGVDDWTTYDLKLIYQKLGNAINPELTYQFIDSGFNIELLRGDK